MEWRANAFLSSLDINGPKLRIARITGNTMSIVTKIQFEDHPRDNFVPATEFNTAIIGPDAVGFMQAIMDAGWEYGLRPSKAQDERHLQAHLEDMRSITRHVLKMNR